MKRLLTLLLIAGALVRAQDEPKIWVHAPAEDLLARFPEKGAGYMISIEEYRKLLDLAKANRARQAEQPPIQARLVSGAVVARVEEEALRLEADYTAVVAGDRPASTSFPVSGLALESAAVEGGALVGGTLRFPGPGTYKVKAIFSARLQRSGETRRADFQLPSAAAHTVTVALPPEVEGEVGPIVRAFRTGPEGGPVVGHPDGNGIFSIWYRPRAPARSLEALLSASFDTVAEIGEARLIARTALRLEVLRSPVDRVDLLLPPGQTVRDLGGKQVKSWRLLRGGGEDRIEIRLVEPVQGTIELTLEAEQPRDGAAQVAVPLVRVASAVRYRGGVGVSSTGEVRITDLRAEGARRLDQPGEGRVALFEVWTAQASVGATVERVESKTRAIVRSLLYLHEGGKALRVRFLYEVGRLNLFRLEPRLPAGWILRSLLLDGAAVEHTYEADGRVLLVFPSGLKPGTHAIDALLDTDEVDWVPNEGAASFEFANVASGLEEESGWFAAASDTAFRVRAEATKGLRPIGMPELAAAGFPSDERMLFAWRHEAPGFAARFGIERHRPQITSLVTMQLSPSERLLTTQATIRFDIQRAGVRELSVALPKGTGDLVDFAGPLIKEKRAPAKDADPEVWTIVFQKRIRGVYRLQVRFDRRFDTEAWRAEVTGLATPDAQERGFLLVSSSPELAVSVERNGLREADVGELPDQPEEAPLEVLAYAAHPYRVAISARRHEPREVVQAIALSAHLYGVLAPDGRLRCRAEYRIRNNDQPFLTFTLPAASRLLGVLVDGQPAKPLVEERRLKLALARSKERLEPVVVAIVYESAVERLDTSGELTIARPSLDVDVLQTDFTLHLPDGVRLTGQEGDLTPVRVPELPSVLEALASLCLPLVPMKSEEMAAAREAPRRSGAKAGRDEAQKKPAGKAHGDVPPGLREPSDPEAAPEPPASGPVPGPTTPSEPPAEAEEGYADSERESGLLAEEVPAKDALAADHNESEDRIEGDRKRAREKKLEESSTLPGSAGDDSDKEVAQAGEDSPTRRPPGKPAAGKRVRVEKALLSLDIEFLKPDNIVRLRSLARDGSATLRYARAERFARDDFLGWTAGIAIGLLAAAARIAWWRRLAGAVLLIAALHFGGLSLLTAEFAVGAALGLVVTMLLFFVLRLVRKIPRLWRRAAPAGPIAALLLLATAARAGDEIYVPYDAKDPEKIERVFLDSETYHKLRKLAFPEEAAGATAITLAEYTATVKEEEVTLLARYEILKETEEAERIPLLLTGVAASEARLDGAPATLGLDKETYVLLLRGKGSHVLEVTLRPRLATEGDARSFQVPVRPVANARLRVAHDRAGYGVEVAALGRTEGDLWHLGPVGLLAVTLRPKTEGFRAPEAELRADTEMVAAIRDGFTGFAARIRYGIRGGTVERVRLRVSKDLVVRGVACAELAGWQIDGEGILTVALAKPAENSLTLLLHAERPAARERQEEFPEIAPLDTQRDAGVIALDTLPDLKIEILEARGLLRGQEAQAPKELPAAEEAGTLHSVHRYATRPFGLRWKVALEATRLRAETRIDIALRRETLEVAATIDVQVERGPGLFSLPLSVPGDFEVVAVEGPGVREFWRDGATLHVELLQRLRGSGRWVLRLKKRADTLQPLEAPAISVQGASREAGLVLVRSDDGLEVEAEEASSLLPEDVAKVQEPGEGLRRAWRYVSTPWRLVVSGREEQREVEAMVVSRVVPLEDHLRVEAIVNFYVRRGLVDTLTFVVPVAEEGAAVVRAPDLREERSEAIEGGRRYVLTLRTPTRGSASAAVTYDWPYDRPVRGVEPLGTSRVQRYVAVERAPEGEVKIGAVERLEPGQFEDLPLVPPETTASTVARVFVGGDGAFSLGISVARHSFEEVARAVVHRAAAQAVVDRSGTVRVFVSYRVYNRSEQFLRLVLPGGAQLYSVFVAGEGVRPLGEGSTLLVPLRKVAIGAPTFDVDVVYAYRGAVLGDGDLPVRLPAVEGIDVRRTTLSLWVPRGFSYDFDTEMERVQEADIVAGEATDRYREIKELYGVAEHGNRWQQERALRNAQALETEARRLGEVASQLTEDQATLDSIETQSRSVLALRQSVQQAEQSLGQTVVVDEETRAQRGRAVEDWSVNAANFRRADREVQEKLQSFTKKQGQYKGAEGDRAEARAGGGDAGVNLTWVAQDGANTVGGFFSSTYEVAEIPEGGGGGGGTGGSGAGTPAEGPPASGEGEDARGGLEFQPPKVTLASAKGRISIRITPRELSPEGEVHHFARLASQGTVVVQASPRNGRWIWGLLSVVGGAAALFLLMGGGRRGARPEVAVP